MEVRVLTEALAPWLTRQRMLLFGATLIAFGFALGGLDTTRDTDDIPEATDIVALSLPEVLPDEVIEEVVQPTPLDDGSGAPWTHVTVQPGQSLDAIFRAQGLSPTLLHEILALTDDTKRLSRINPGQEFAFLLDDAGSFSAMRYSMSEDAYLVVEQQQDGLVARTDARPLVAEVHDAGGTIESSLFLAGQQAGLSDAKIMELAHIFGWDIDFILDIREGDEFHVIFEKLYRDGEYLRDGNILAATFVNQGQRYQAIRFETDEGADYYAPDGKPMRKAFLRAPLSFSYISSHFNPRRFHPVLKRVKAHNGIDYRAPTGTPVYAAGAGRVTRSAYSPANGHHVFIEHAGSIVTKYLHFSKRAVKQGDRVRQGQVIGYVGSTGLSTAPHLHYEFVVNGVHRNPRTVPLPQAVPLQGEQLVAFRAHSAPYLTQLARLESDALYATAP